MVIEALLGNGGFAVELLPIWKVVDHEINAVLAMTLSTLSLATATFLTRWVETKQGDFLASANKSTHETEKARRQLLQAQQGVKDLLLAFVAFAILLAESIFVDPMAVVGDKWSGSLVFDAVVASGSLAAGMVLFLKAVWNIHGSVAD